MEKNDIIYYETIQVETICKNELKNHGFIAATLISYKKEGRQIVKKITAVATSPEAVINKLIKFMRKISSEIECIGKFNEKKNERFLKFHDAIKNSMISTTSIEDIKFRPFHYEK